MNIEFRKSLNSFDEFQTDFTSLVNKENGNTKRNRISNIFNKSELDRFNEVISNRLKLLGIAVNGATPEENFDLLKTVASICLCKTEIKPVTEFRLVEAPAELYIEITIL